MCGCLCEYKVPASQTSLVSTGPAADRAGSVRKHEKSLAPREEYHASPLSLTSARTCIMALESSGRVIGSPFMVGCCDRSLMHSPFFFVNPHPYPRQLVDSHRPFADSLPTGRHRFPIARIRRTRRRGGRSFFSFAERRVHIRMWPPLRSLIGNTSSTAIPRLEG